MGAIEAAMNNKPVIMARYGGCKEYVSTPFIIDQRRRRLVTPISCSPRV